MWLRAQLEVISLSSELPEHFICASYGISSFVSDVTVVPQLSPYSRENNWWASSGADSSLIPSAEPSLGLPSIAAGKHLLSE